MLFLSKFEPNIRVVEIAKLEDIAWLIYETYKVVQD